MKQGQRGIPGGGRRGSGGGKGHTLLPVDAQVALLWGALTRRLRRTGQLIGSNDLWIAATSLRHGLPLVTADAGHFGRIEGLEVVGYR